MKYKKLYLIGTSHIARQSLDEIEWVHPSRTRHAHDAHVGRVLDANDASQVSSSIAAPGAQKRNNFGFPICL